jgi:hypothetical protein
MISIKDVSLAKRWMSLSMLVVISLINIKNNSGPRIDP